MWCTILTLLSAWWRIESDVVSLSSNYTPEEIAIIEQNKLLNSSNPHGLLKSFSSQQAISLYLCKKEK